jgi:ferredoxin
LNITDEERNVFNMVSSSTDSQAGLRRWNYKEQSVEFRRENRGKSITDNLRTIKIDPLALDSATEISPLPELAGGLRDPLRAGIKVEFPKWRKRGKLIEYGWGVIRSLIRMNAGQRDFMKNASSNKEEDLAVLKKEIKQFAERLGYICGFTLVDRRFISQCRDRYFPFDTALVLGMEMDFDLLEEVPNPGERLFDFEVYIESGKRVFDMAEFIRSKGYRCFARVPFDGGVKYPPHAINAGLGELGAQGVVITREFGPRVRWTMISIDADIEIDKPIDLGIADYCDHCLRCVAACPGDAITPERIWWRGVYKRKNNDARCWPYFVRYEGCGICLKVCPFNRFGYDACMKAFKKDGTILKNQDEAEESSQKR